MKNQSATPSETTRVVPLHRLRKRGVLRVAASYAVIAWLTLQIASVVFDPLGVPEWVLTALIIAAAVGFPVAIALAWFLEVGEHGVELDTAAEGVPRPTARGLRHYADAIVIGVLLITVVVLLVRQSDIGRPKPRENPAIAVLPFENLSGDPAQEYFSDGLAEEMLDRLGRVPGLRVIARSSSFSFKGKEVDARTIAERLSVTIVLEGSVRRDGKRLKLSARLIDGASGQQVWSGSFDREVTDVFAMQAELARSVVEAIIPAARGEVAASAPPPTTSLDAHDHYLLGLAAQRSRSVSRLAESVAHLEQAVALDPNYAQAYAALARSLLLWSGYGEVQGSGDFSDPLVRAERAAHKALALDPSSSDAHGALGSLLSWTGRPGAEVEFKRALQLNPNNAIVTHDYANLLSNIPGHEAESTALSDRALELDPRSAIDWANKLQRVYETSGVANYQKQFAAAIKVFEGDADGLAALALAGGDIPGDPYVAFKLNYAIERAGGERADISPHLLRPLIVLGEYGQCLARLDAINSAASAPSFTPLELEAAGLKGDYRRLDQAMANPGRAGATPRHRYAVDAFWFSVQGRFDEATAALARAGEVAQEGGFPMGSSLSLGGLPAIVRVYRATGREAQAQALIADFQRHLREEIGSRAPDASENVLLAEVAISARHPAEAVRHLQTAMKQAPLPFGFHPVLPWFRSLEDEPGYAAVVAELEMRRAAIRAQVARLGDDRTGVRD